MPKIEQKSINIDKGHFAANCSIIIPFHGQYPLVVDLVKSILYTTKGNFYEIILVDDASPDQQFGEVFKDTARVKFLRSDKHLGFGGALHLGFENSQYPWIVFLNSDTIIEEPNWLAEMHKTLQVLRPKNVKMVSARMNNPGSYAPLAMKCSTKNQRIEGNDLVLENEFLPLICTMTHRDLFHHINGFVKNYPYGGYEDEELFHRMKHFKFKQAISARAWIRHKGEATISALCKENPEVAKIIENNRNYCVNDIRKYYGK